MVLITENTSIQICFVFGCSKKIRGESKYSTTKLNSLLLRKEITRTLLHIIRALKVNYEKSRQIVYQSTGEWPTLYEKLLYAEIRLVSYLEGWVIYQLITDKIFFFLLMKSRV